MKNALPENTPIAFGTVIRILDAVEGDAANVVRVGGIAVPFTDEENKDLYGTWWDKDSYLGARSAEGEAVVDTYVHHRIPLDKTKPELVELSKRRLAPSTLRITAEGLWAETVLDMNDKYEKRVAEMVESKRLFWSSSTTPHLFECDEETGYVREWPVAEVSLTPTPGTPFKRTQITTLRALMDMTEEAASKPDTSTMRAELLGDQLEADMAMAAIDRLHNTLYWKASSILHDWDRATQGGTAEEKMAVLDPMIDEFADIWKRTVRALMSAAPAAEVKQVVETIRALVAERMEGETLRAGQVLNAANKKLSKEIKDLAKEIGEKATAMLSSAGVEDEAEEGSETERSAPAEEPAVTNESGQTKPTIRRLSNEAIVALTKIS